MEWHLISRAERISESFDRVYLCVTAKLAAAFDCILDCFDDQVLMCQRWLHDVLVFEIDGVGDSFCACGLDKNEVAAIVIRGRR